MINPNGIFSRIMSVGAVQRQSIVSLTWQLALTSIGFLSTMYFAHAVGASVLGAYFLLIVYYSIISMVTDGGFGGAAIKRISEGEEQNEYLSAFFAARSLFLIAAILFLIIFRSYFVDLNNSGLFGWLLLILLVSGLAGVVNAGLAGRGNMGIRSTSNFLGDFSRIIVQVVAVFFGFGAAGLAGGFVAFLLVGTIIEWHFFDLHLVRFGRHHIKSLSTFAFWSFLASSGGMLYSYADTIMIGYYLDDAHVGVYRVIFQFSAVALLVANSLNFTLWPNISKWGKINEMGLVEESLSRAFSFSLLLAVPILVGGVLLGDKLLYFFYGAEFAWGYGTLVVMLVVQIVSVFQGFFLNYLSALDHQKSAFKVTSVAAMANIVLNFILIPVIGIIGAAVATLVTLALNAYLARRLLSQIITVRVERNSILNIFKASAVMSVIVMVFRLFVPLSSLWLALVPVFLGGAVYGILILKFDSKIYGELKAVVTQMNIPWPHWL